jgi:hypothetical protein
MNNMYILYLKRVTPLVFTDLIYRNKNRTIRFNMDNELHKIRIHENNAINRIIVQS